MTTHSTLGVRPFLNVRDQVTHNQVSLDRKWLKLLFYVADCKMAWNCPRVDQLTVHVSTVKCHCGVWWNCPRVDQLTVHVSTVKCHCGAWWNCPRVDQLTVHVSTVKCHCGAWQNSVQFATTDCLSVFTVQLYSTDRDCTAVPYWLVLWFTKKLQCTSHR